jgi:CheY-like chemotaxis protein
VTETQSRGPERRITVVLVEDDPNDALLIRMAFERTAGEMGFVHLLDGDAAVRYLAGESPYDGRAQSPAPTMMLLDIKLPRRSGFDVLKWARTQPAPINRVPILMLTSSIQKSDVDRAFDLGASAYIRKPSKTKQLSEMVADLKTFWIKWAETPEV